MNPLAYIGRKDKSLHYTDRPTVKVIVKSGDSILLLNDGLLPGGGIDEGESHHEAIARELIEEIGATVRSIETIGTVIQYRNLINKRYVIHGYSATLSSDNKKTNPQDAGEASFSKVWVSLEEGLKIVSRSINAASSKSMSSDTNQGRLYNLMTTEALLKQL